MKSWQSILNSNRICAQCCARKKSQKSMCIRGTFYYVIHFVALLLQCVDRSLLVLLSLLILSLSVSLLLLLFSICFKWYYFRFLFLTHFYAKSHLKLCVQNTHINVLMYEMGELKSFSLRKKTGNWIYWSMSASDFVLR